MRNRFNIADREGMPLKLPDSGELGYIANILFSKFRASTLAATWAEIDAFIRSTSLSLTSFEIDMLHYLSSRYAVMYAQCNFKDVPPPINMTDSEKAHNDVSAKMASFFESKRKKHV